MDRNGYNDSIMATTAGVCYLCGRNCATARHEVFYGTGTRALSKRYGLWINICPDCHEFLHANPESKKAEQVRDEARDAFIAEGHTPAEFTRIFITGNIKWWEIDNG